MKQSSSVLVQHLFAKQSSYRMGQRLSVGWKSFMVVHRRQSLFLVRQTKETTLCVCKSPLRGNDIST